MFFGFGYAVESTGSLLRKKRSAHKLLRADL
jgi:hypothetical protein